MKPSGTWFEHEPMRGPVVVGPTPRGPEYTDHAVLLAMAFGEPRSFALPIGVFAHSFDVRSSLDVALAADLERQLDKAMLAPLPVFTFPKPTTYTWPSPDCRPRPSKGWRRHVRRLKAAGLPIPKITPRSFRELRRRSLRAMNAWTDRAILKGTAQ